MKKLFLLWLIIVSVVHASANELFCRLRTFDTNSGLLQAHIANSIQDDKGFMWFATWVGLVRYDGYSFQTYKPMFYSAGSILNNRIYSIKLNTTGNIWCVSSDNQLYLFDKRQNHFTDVLSRIPEVRQQKVQTLHVLAKGVTWVVFKDGSCLRLQGDDIGQGYAYYPVGSEAVKGSKVFDVAQDARAREWIFTDGGTYCPDDTAGTSIPFNAVTTVGDQTFLTSLDGRLYQWTSDHRWLSIPLPIQTAHIYKTLAYHDRYLALATDDGVLLYHTGTRRFRAYPLAADGVSGHKTTFLYEDVSHRLWAYTDSRYVFLIDIEAGTTRPLTSSKSLIREKISKQVLIFEDRYNHVIVKPEGCVLAYYDEASGILQDCPFYDDRGITTFDPYVIRKYWLDKQKNLWLFMPRETACITFYPKYFSASENKERVESRAIMRDAQHRLWVADRAYHIALYDSTGTWMGYVDRHGEIARQPDTFSPCPIFHLFEDREQRVWVSTKGDGLYCLQQRPGGDGYRVGHYRRQSGRVESLSSDTLYCTFQDREGHLWCGSYEGGLNRIITDRGEVQFAHYNHGFGSYPKAFMKVRCIAQAADGTLLVGTTHGLLTVDITDVDRPRFFGHSFSVREGALKANDIMSIHTLGDSIFLSVYGCGVSCVVSGNLCSDRLDFKTYYIPENSTADQILTSVYDGEGNIWLVSELSLSKFSLSDHTFSIYDNSSFMSRLNFSEATPDLYRGVVTVGTSAGTLSFRPRQIEAKKSLPMIVFTGIQYRNEKQIHPVNDLEELTLAPDQRSLSLYISSLNYISPGDVQYKYQLQGYETGWNYTNVSNTVNYSNLPTGDYTLVIHATDNEGVWSRNTRSIRVHVTPLFVETAWFALLQLLLALLVVVAVVVGILYVYKLRHRAILEQEISDVKIDLFTDISNELRTPLTLIEGPLNEVIDKESSLSPSGLNHLKVAHRNSLLLSQMINHIFDFKKTESDSERLIVEQEEVSALLHPILQRFETVTSALHAAIHLHVADAEVLLWLDKGKFEKIILFVLSDICRFLDEGAQIDLQLTQTETDVRLSFITDRALIRYLYSSVQMLTDVNSKRIQHLVALHGGTMTLSRALKNKNCLVLSFPKGNARFLNRPNVDLIVDHYRTDEESDLPMQPVGEDSRESILIIEPDGDLRHFLSDILGGDYAVMTAIDRAQGLQLAEEKMPDFIVADLTADDADPEWAGWVRDLKSNRMLCHIPVVVLSSEVANSKREEAFGCGADDYIIKPFSSSYLRSRIANIMNQRHLLQQSYYLQFAIDKASQEAQPATDAPVETPPTDDKTADYNREFIRKTIDFFDRNISNKELVVDDFAQELNMSRTVFYSKMRAIVGVSPIDFIKQLRIKRAIYLFDHGEQSVTTVAFLTGFSDPKYFAKCFRSEMNMTPSQYLNKQSPV